MNMEVSFAHFLANCLLCLVVLVFFGWQRHHHTDLYEILCLLSDIYLRMKNDEDILKTLTSEDNPVVWNWYS